MAQNVVDGWKVEPVNGPQKITAKAPGVLDAGAYRGGAIQLNAARGETESFQFIVSAVEAPIQKLEIKANGLATVGADFIESQKFEFYRENYVYVAHPSGNFDLTPKWWPDALIPLDLAKTNIEKGQSAVFWATLHIPADAKPGDYFGELDLLADGKPRRLAVSLKVFDIALPAPTFRGTVAVYYEALRDWYAKNAGKTFTDEEWAVQKKRYYDFLLDYGLNAYDLPVSWNSPEVEAYLKKPRVLSVRTPPLSSPDFQLALDKFKATNTLGKAFYYWIDEPGPDRYAEVRATTEKLRALGIKHLVTVHPNQALKDDVAIWAPNIGDFFGIGHVDWRALAAERAKGRETWLYTMVEPKWPYPTWLLDDSATAVRDYGPLWARNGINGFVYSMAHGWGPKPLENLESFAGTNGDGTLLYPAELVGGVGPMPSIRLMLLRDAIEDYELGKTGSRYWGEKNLFSNRPVLTFLPANGHEFLDQQRQQFAKTPASQGNSEKPLKARLSLPPPPPPNLGGESEDGFGVFGKSSNPSLDSPPRLGGGGGGRESRAFQAASKVGWKRKGDDLTVFFYAPDPQPKDYVAVELAPREAGEKWRFIATAKGNTVVERHTRDGAFRVENFGFTAKVTPEAGAYRVEMKISLADLVWAKKGVRFDAFRSTSLPETGTHLQMRLNDYGSDPFAMPLLANK